MFVTDDMIRGMEEQFGTPERRDFRIECSISELQRIASSQKSGRNHDVTLYVQMGERWIVIAKHPYPNGLFRSPSGGIHPGEDFMTGINREVAEELGCRVKIERFLLRTDVDFVPESGLTGPDVPPPIYWRSFIFLASYIDGDFNYTDHDEIREVKVVDWDQFAEYGKIMRQSDSGGLRYRAELHEAVAGILGKV